jgi:acyl-CoA thioester hydrolase
MPPAHFLGFAEIPIHVKTYDVDFGQIVHNAVYIRWLEDLRTALLDKYCPLDTLMAEDLCPVLAHTHIEYRRAVTLFDKPMGRAWMTRIGNVKWELVHEISVNDVVCAYAEQSGAVINLKTRAATRIPARMRTGFDLHTA